jgi:hypothetical protein
VSFRIRVDPTNPGQFFAACGLFELAGRLDHLGAPRARFAREFFEVECTRSLTEVLSLLVASSLRQVDEQDDTSSASLVPEPFDLLINWWQEPGSNKDLKVWAGTMQSVRIARAMLAVFTDSSLHTEDLLDHGCVVYDPADRTKKVEPFYFDARRAGGAHSRDVGFSPNDLHLTTTAFPAVEVLCLFGLQRCRPRPASERRTFESRSWADWIPLSVAAAVAGAQVSTRGQETFRFESWFRTGQRKHKAFRPAIKVEHGGF